jgi:hypothetical protein
LLRLSSEIHPFRAFRREAKVFIFGHAGLTLMGYQLFNRGRTSSSPLGASQLGALVLFALLPDILDKPLTLWFVPEAVSTRWLGHTMAFSVLVCSAAHLFAPSLKNLAWACPGHLLLDGMWRSPHTLFFPLLGWEMDPGSDPSVSLWDLLASSISRLLHEPGLIFPELLGLMVLLLALLRLCWTHMGRARVPQGLHRPRV